MRSTLDHVTLGLHVQLTISTVLLVSLLIPIRGDSPFRAEVIEESPVGTLISGVAEYLSELKTNGDVQYQLLGDDGVSRLVSLNPTTGQLRVRARIDREVLCPGGGNANPLLPASGVTDLLGELGMLNHKSGITTTIMECVQPLNILLVSRAKDPTQNVPNSIEMIPRTSRILIHLVIRDINDNAPMWTQGSQLEIGFVETPSSRSSGWTPLGSGGGVGSATAGSPVGANLVEDSAAKNARTIDRAVDLDLGMNSTIVYRLLGPGAEYFRLDDGAQSTVDDVDFANKFGPYLSHSPLGGGASNSYGRPGPLQLWPIVPLDRETEDFAGRGGLFNLTLLATDMGLPPKTGSVNLLIHVIDVNDHVPVFHNDMYSSSVSTLGGRMSRGDAGIVVYRPPAGTIRETVPVGSLIIQLNATDKDSGAHAKLVYEFCPCDRSSAMEYLKIDRDSGRISVIKPLDYDQGPRQFQFKVIAKDSAPEPYTLTGTALVEIALTDENDEAPMIHVMLLRPPSGGETRHLLSAGTLSPSGSVAGMKFLGEYTTSIHENPQPESIIAYVQVTDQDHHGQDQVHCRLGPTDNFTLQLDPVGAQQPAQQQYQQQQQQHQGEYSSSVGDGSGTLNRQDFRLVTGTGMISYSSLYHHPLDRETTAVQRITITCTDSVGNAAYVLIHVHLLDVNDHAPEFVNGGQFAFQLTENQELIGGKPLWLGRTVATDKDIGENALITYQFRNDDTGLESSGGVMQSFESHPSRLFELDTQTGNLYAKTVFDREAAPSGGIYRLRVLAIDNGSPRLTGTATVEVFILDVNDWAPQFTKDVYTFSVAEDARIQEVIGMVEAIDRDADSQGKVTYHLVTHTRQKRNIRTNSSSSPLVRRQASPDSHEEGGSNEVAELRNASTSATTTTTMFNVNLLNPSHEINVADGENLVPETYYAPVSLDRNGVSGSSSSSAATHSSYFSVDRLTGKIRLIRRLDRESIAFFSLEIVATDAPPVSVLPVFHQTVGSDGRNYSTESRRTQLGPQSLSTTTTVVIAVTDVNDNAPVFRRPNTSTAIQLRMHETLGRQLLIIEATDADEGENARVTYYIRSEVPRPPGGPGTGFFAVDETSGVLFLAKTLNSSTTHRLVVEACDNGSGATRRCSLSPSIRITVSDQENPNLMLDPAMYQSRSSSSSAGLGGDGASMELPFDLDSVSMQRVNPSLQSGRRNELVIICLVVVFSILLLATIVLVACLVHRRGARTWFMGGRTNGSHMDVPSYAKEIAAGKPNGTGRMSVEPWLDDNSHNDQMDIGLDTKFETCKSAQYDQPNDLKYLGHEAMLTGAAYPIASSGYLPHPGTVKFIQGGGPSVSCVAMDGQSMTLATHHMTPMRVRQLNSPPMDYMANALDMHGGRMMPRNQPNAEMTELLTQSTYKPPSPDYQSLDVMWHRIPRSELAPINHRITRYRNPIPNQAVAAYAIGQSPAKEFNRPTNIAERNLFPSPMSNEMPRSSDAVHTYYEITGPKQQQQHQKQNQPNSQQNAVGGSLMQDKDLLQEDWSVARIGPKTYSSSSATLGRPTAGKGKRRCTAKGDSMYNQQAGELVLHSGKKRTGKKSTVSADTDTEDRVEQKCLPNQADDTTTTYGTKPSEQYQAYQAYREGTFV